MTRAEQFEALALRCEQATGADRRLDAEIDCLVRFPDLRPAELDDHKEYQRGFPPGAGDIWCPTGFLMAASYTASLDAAMTLVPEGLVILGAFCSDGTYQVREAWFHRADDDELDGLILIDGYTKPNKPPLAISSAALRARAQIERWK